MEWECDSPWNTDFNRVCVSIITTGLHQSILQTMGSMSFGSDIPFNMHYALTEILNEVVEKKCVWADIV